VTRWQQAREEESVSRSSDAKVRALPLSFPDDASLARAAAEGHPAAARCVWERYSTFFRLVHRLREADKMRSFLVGISIRVAREELRRRRVRRWLTLSRDGNVPERARATDLDAAEALGRLYALLDRVDADTRLVFVLRHVEQIPTAELTDVLGCSLATAKRRVKRATERIERLAQSDAALMAFVRKPSGDRATDEEDRHG
jgi:RNA polymerase sigma-70 factor (ECF subfamily)